MTYLVVIPARGGSKGIPLKNIYPLCGKPLLEYSIEAMNAVDFEGDLVVSTDSDKIAQVAAQYPNVICIHRPEEISGDKASTEAALIHAVEYMKARYGREYDAVVTLQPTSPLRTPETIRAFLATYEQGIDRFDAQLALSEDRSDFWVKNEDGSFARLYPNAPRRRQERNPLYVENSCLYVTATQSLMETKFVLGHRVNGFVIPTIEAIDINEPVDLKIAEAYINQLK